MDEYEFQSENEKIEIIPMFRYDRQLILLTGKFGPFRPSIPVKVPIWLAKDLYMENKCTIVSPEWVSQMPTIQEEQENECDKLLPLPDENWKAILKLVEKNFSKNIECSDLLERRDSILKKSIHELLFEARDRNNMFIGDITLDNATPIELLQIKDIIIQGFKRIQELRRNLQQAIRRKHHH